VTLTNFLEEIRQRHRIKAAIAARPI